MLFKPISVVIIGITRWLVPGPSSSFTAPTPFVTREDIKILAREGEQEGILSPRERVMIHRVIELSGKCAHQIMVPREKMCFVESGISVAAFLDRARGQPFTRMPVYDPQQRRFTGVVNVFHVLSTATSDDTRSIGHFMRPPLFVPETIPVDDLLPRMRRFRQPMCLVTNADGDVTGLVTTEDILEEIVGKL
jgi:CBS domain containing-hemolysin-like protein